MLCFVLLTARHDPWDYTGPCIIFADNFNYIHRRATEVAIVNRLIGVADSKNVTVFPRVVFKGGLRVQPSTPRNVEKKFFGNVKKHAQRNVSADALYVCTIVMPGKVIWCL